MLEQLKELIVNYVDVDPASITEDSRFAEDLGFNSYDFICMLGDCEDEFELEVEQTEAAKSKTVGELITYLEGAKA